MSNVEDFVLKIIKNYSKQGLECSELSFELESKEYYACSFEINDELVIFRKSKITPKKIGQFVTFWKRDLESKETAPYRMEDKFSYFIVVVQSDDYLGQFKFPKSVLLSKKIVSYDNVEGKRGFRVYPAWVQAENQQAKKTQKWQLDYFEYFDDPQRSSRA